MLLVPPTGATGLNVVFLCPLFFFLALKPLWFPLYFFLLLSSIINVSLLKGVVWCGWITSLLCLLCRIVWRRAAGHSWPTQNGDGRQDSKVPGGRAGRIWLCYSYIPVECFVLWFACYSPLVLSLNINMLTSINSGVFFSLFFFFGFFSSVCHIPCGGVRHFFLLFRFVFFVFVFALLCFLSFLYFLECVCRASRIHLSSSFFFKC